MEDNQLPLVSICMPVYNAGKFVHGTLTSLENQTYSNIELIIVDDGSSDGGLAVIRSFSNRINLKIIEQLNCGAGAARNKAFLASQGSFIKFLDADDLINETMIEAQVNLARKYPNTIISSRWGRFYNNDLNTFRESPESVWRNMNSLDWITESWNKGPNMTQPGIFLIPRELINKSGLWKEDLSKGPCDDMEFFTRLMLQSKKIIFCHEGTLFYNSGIIGSLSGKKDRIGYEKYLETILLSIQQVIKVSKSTNTRHACANQLQAFAYDAYPKHKDLYEIARKKIIDLGGSTYQFPSGDCTKYIAKLVGWKLVKRFREFLNNQLVR